MSSPPASPTLSASSSTQSLPPNLDDIIKKHESKQSTKSRDFFDSVLSLEEQYISEGYLEGRDAAFQAATIQGKNLGFEYGQDLGEEIGFYVGFFTSFLFNLLQQQQSNEGNGGGGGIGTTSSEKQSQCASKSPTVSSYNLQYGDPTLTLDQIKEYNRTFFLDPLLNNPQFKAQLMAQLSFSTLKYTGVVTEMINLLSLTQSIRFMPGESGDLHLVTDVRTRTKALFARLGVSGVFKDASVTDF